MHPEGAKEEGALQEGRGGGGMWQGASRPADTWLLSKLWSRAKQRKLELKGRTEKERTRKTEIKDNSLASHRDRDPRLGVARVSRRWLVPAPYRQDRYCIYGGFLFFVADTLHSHSWKTEYGEWGAEGAPQAGLWGLMGRSKVLW